MVIFHSYGTVYQRLHNILRTPWELFGVQMNWPVWLAETNLSLLVCFFIADHKGQPAFASKTLQPKGPRILVIAPFRADDRVHQRIRGRENEH